QLADVHKECRDIPNAMTDPSVSMSNQCVCKDGFKGPARFGLDSVDAKCVDIDECFNQNVCGADLECMNTQGSYQCTCKSGFTNYNATHCEDKDECKDGSANCHAIAACKNQHGFYQCFCPQGYTGSGVGSNGCTDLNECQNAMVCGVDASCKNLIGSYECTKCDAGHINVKGFCE
ncbi:latent-transforming growth factor beta-binding protein 3-like, partial [Actinia tenebrosa]|uniref:Latent-transforming growth factor beta-binding protein 3-like n=1 Tax=Actinia tenebrosa TaxID=6105 RepID=A0A6P8HT18_ACTTE